jgi:predicted MFS family arabinose efflux permease
MGVLVMAAGVWALGRDPSEKGLPPQRKKVVLKREYGLFYLLTFLSGARRQVFVAFASFLMVKKFGFTIPEITLLFVANNALNWWLNPWVGRAIVRYGERWVLSAEYGSLVLLFVAYALVSDKALVGFLYVVDNVFFNFYLAINTYFQKIADPRDIAPSMAVGSAINHITAVVLPALGGLIWMIDYRIIFYSGAVLAFLTFMVAQWVPAKPDEKQVTEQS